MYMIGIDGGGTKTIGVLAHRTGEIVAKATVGASNPNLIDEATLTSHFDQLFTQLKAENQTAFTQVKRVFAGISGCGHPLAKEKVTEQICSTISSPAVVSVDHDATIALYSGTLGQPGIVQISGTGSVTYGINASGERGRVGGWGHLLGESGSGYSLGSGGLKAIFAAHDGLGPETILTERILAFFAKEEVPDIVHTIYRMESYKENIAAIGKLVTEAADENDGIAKRLLHENAEDLAEAISCLINRLFTVEKEHEKIPLVLTGGLFRRLDLFQSTLAEAFKRRNHQVQMITPQIEPVGGAVIAAVREENETVDQKFLETFIQSWEGE